MSSIFGMLSQLQLVDIGRFDGQEQIPIAGKTNVELTVKVPQGIKRLLTFGFVGMVEGDDRNYRLFVKNQNKDVKRAISPNTNISKGLGGYQILFPDDVIVADFAAAANIGFVDYSISYFDYVGGKAI